MLHTKLAKVDWYDSITGDGVISVDGKAYASFYIEQAYHNVYSCNVINRRIPKAGDSVLAEVYENGYTRIVTTLLIGQPSLV